MNFGAVFSNSHEFGHFPLTSAKPEHESYTFNRDLRSAEKESAVKREAQIGSPQK
jgi:hypothetical protein